MRDFIRNKIAWLVLVLMLALPLNVAAANLRGDVNDDGNVNITDLTELIDYLLSGNAIEYTPVADVNADTAVSIADVTALIDYLLGGSELEPIGDPDEPQYYE